MKFTHLLALAALMIAPLSGCTCYQVDPGTRGVQIDVGKIKEPAHSEGDWGVLLPWQNMVKVNVRQQKHDMDTVCFSSDLQQVHAKLSVRYRIPESSVIRIYRDFHGDPFDVLVANQVQESLKEATAALSAEQIVKQRETIKTQALDHARKKIGDILVVEDLVITDLSLSDQLENAIEAKMVQEQEAAKAKFTTMKAEAEAEATVAKANGEAKAIRIRAEALQNNTGIIQLEQLEVQRKLIEKWDGKSPQIVSGGSGVNLLLPAGH